MKENLWTFFFLMMLLCVIAAPVFAYFGRWDIATFAVAYSVWIKTGCLPGLEAETEYWCSGCFKNKPWE